MEDTYEKTEELIRSQVRRFDRSGVNPRLLFTRLHSRALELGITPEQFQSLHSLTEIQESSKINLYKYARNIIIALTLFSLTVVFIFLIEWPLTQIQVAKIWFFYQDLNASEEKCLFLFPVDVGAFTRPPIEDCGFCKNVSQVDRISGISPAEFESKYAYTGRPVVITDATVNWTAFNAFSFQFLKSLYGTDSYSLDNNVDECSFFPYKTNFTSLREVFEMSEERAKLKDGSDPWYIGWSNCDFSAANTLRKHYTRPYFLPKVAESIKTDWIFMGSPGYGANLHIDNVGHPSWQAQIVGTKKWTLEIPSECYYSCPSTRFEATVHPGEIIVLDTDRWFHSTLNVGDDISITIGAEYD